MSTREMFVDRLKERQRELALAVKASQDYWAEKRRCDDDDDSAPCRCDELFDTADALLKAIEIDPEELEEWL